jgi:hypothetical protein
MDFDDRLTKLFELIYKNTCVSTENKIEYNTKLRQFLSDLQNIDPHNCHINNYIYTTFSQANITSSDLNNTMLWVMVNFNQGNAYISEEHKMKIIDLIDNWFY